MDSLIIFFVGLLIGWGVFTIIQIFKKRLLFSGERFNFQSFPLCVFMYKKGNDKISYVNDKALGLLGVAGQSKVQGKEFSDFFKIQHQKESWEDTEYVIENTKGVKRYFNKFLFDYSKSEYAEILFDITEYKNNERQLKKAQEFSDKANRTKSLFLASMSHEIRTPMNAIIGISNMLMRYQNKNLTKKQLEGIGLINSSGDRLLNLINEILDLSKIEAGKMVLNKKEILLSNMFSQLKVLVYSLIANKEITFHINKSNSLPERIYVDNNKLNQILINILGNAVKFTEKGSIVLKAHKKENELVFEVTDTGIGIEEKDIPYIFDEFKQLSNDKQLEQDNQGTGLGLALCKKIVNLMGGGIFAESKVSKGTTVTFTIPIEISGEKKTASQNKKKLPKQEEVEKDSKINVLVIDKDYDTYYLLENYIESYNCHVYHAVTSAKGLQMLEQVDPQIIFLELDMPDYSGYDILYRLKKEGCKSRQVIVHSSISCPSQEKYCYNKYLKKPVDDSELKLMLKDIFSVLKSPDRKRILLVEDDESNAYTLKLMLDNKYDLKFAKNGKQGIEKFLQTKPDLVLMDIKMPVLDGVESLKEIKKYDTKTPILAITAKVMPYEKLEIIYAGFDDLIPKPVVQEKLMNSIRQFL